MVILSVSVSVFLLPPILCHSSQAKNINDKKEPKCQEIRQKIHFFRMCTELYQDPRADGDPGSVRGDSQDPDADQGKQYYISYFFYFNLLLVCLS